MKGKTMKKLIACDLDGTLLNNNKEITDNTRNAIIKFMNNGNYFAIATGRIYQATKAIYRDLGFVSYSIACNGAMLVNNITDEIIYKNPIPVETALEVVDLIKSYDIYYHYYSEDTIHAERYEKTVKRFDEVYSQYPEELRIKIHMSDDLSTPINDGVNVYKFGVYDDGTFDIAKFKSDLDKIEGISYYYSTEHLLDIMTRGVTKGHALIQLANHLGVDISDTYAFGDNENDIGMIKDAGHGIAMENGIDELKSYADYVTLSNEDDGIVYAIENYINLR